MPTPMRRRARRLMDLGFLVVSCLVAAGVTTLGYLAFLQPVNPITSHRLISIEAAGQGAYARLVVTREFCLSRPAEAMVLRVYKRAPTRPGAPEEILEVQPTLIHLDAGCLVRTRRIEMPDSIEPGRYRYRSGMRFCNSLWRCQTEWLPEVNFEIDGDSGRHTLRLMPNSDHATHEDRRFTTRRGEPWRFWPSSWSPEQ